MASIGWLCRWSSVFLSSAILLGSPASAAEPATFPLVRFPLAQNTAVDADRFLDERRLTVIRANACGRELEYTKQRVLLAKEEYDGEGLLALLMAKIAWIKREGTNACVDVQEYTFPEGTTAAALKGYGDALLSNWNSFWRNPGNPADPKPAYCGLMERQDLPEARKLVLRFTAGRECFILQINHAIQLMKQRGRMGTSSPVPLPCLETLFQAPGGPEGEYDSVLKELLRVFYLAGAFGKEKPDYSIIWEETVDHAYQMLLSARGSLGSASFSAISDCSNTANESLGSPEETADREYFGNELLDAIGSVGDWFSDHIFQAGIVALLAPVSIPVVLLLPVIDFPTGIVSPPFDVQVPETENHRLMIETSRYLTNTAIIAHLERVKHDNVYEIRAQQREVREWLLKTLHRIAHNDFDEYNARSYTRYSLRSILNLYDFADDGTNEGKALQRAARIVLNLSSAKFAAGSNRGRRTAPFRRLSEHDGSNPESGQAKLYNIIGGSDYEVVRSILLAGQTQLREDGAIPAHFNYDETTNMVFDAVSSYSLPTAILEVAVEKKLPYRQIVRHAGLEEFFAQRGFTTSVGGVQTGAALGITLLNINPFGKDHGVAMPTTIIPSTLGDNLHQLPSFKGVDVGEDRSENMCAWRGFICGVDATSLTNENSFLRKQEECLEVKTSGDGSTLYFMSSTRCPKNKGAPHIFLAAKIWKCDGAFCPEGKNYGVMEAVDAPEGDIPSQFGDFKASREAAFDAIPRAAAGMYESAHGDRIQFSFAEPRPRVTAVNGIVRPRFEVSGRDSHYVTRGAVINVANGETTIRSPWSNSRIRIVFGDWQKPEIYDEMIDALDTAGLFLAVNNETRYFRHIDAAEAARTGIDGLLGAVSVGDGLARYERIIPVIGAPVIYGMEPGGDLYWQKFNDGKWSDPKLVGNGWNVFDKIIAGDSGVMYGRYPDGRLRWYRHLDVEGGTRQWAADRDVGVGWNGFIEVFAGEAGVLYGVRPNGDLIWHRHLGYADGAQRWAASVPPVGSSWQNFRAIRSTARGVIYAVTPAGELIWYRHLAHASGTYSWANNLTIGHGWRDFRHVFALSWK